MAEEVEAIRERAGVVHESLTDLRAEQLDSRSLVIAIAAMVFLPLTFITGLYGMNVEGLWFAKEPWAFDAIVVLCAVIAAGTVVTRDIPDDSLVAGVPGKVVRKLNGAGEESAG